MGQQIGLYLMNNHNPSSSTFAFYTRLGLDYRLTELLSVGTSLRAHVLLLNRGVEVMTDFIDFRVSYSF